MPTLRGVKYGGQFLEILSGVGIALINDGCQIGIFLDLDDDLQSLMDVAHDQTNKVHPRASL
jgi:hypothetical protein